MAVKTEAGAGEIVQVVNFRLGDEEFGADVYSVKEITRVPDITPLPKAPDFIYGLTNLRGQVIAVIDLARRFGLPGKEKLTNNARIVVAEVQGQTVGLLVDEVPEVLKIPGENIKPAPELVLSKPARDFIKGVGKLDDRLIILLDLARVISLEDTGELDRARE